MAERYVRVVITTDVRVVDPTWDNETLRENLVHYVEAMMDRAEEACNVAAALDDETRSYELATEDTTVFVADEFVLDLADIAAMSPDQRAAMSVLANLPPIERRDFWYSTYANGVPA
jgi:hypothetical protein